MPGWSELKGYLTEHQYQEQAGAELCQAQASLPIMVVTFGKLRTFQMWKVKYFKRGK